VSVCAPRIVDKGMVSVKYRRYRKGGGGANRMEEMMERRGGCAPCSASSCPLLEPLAASVGFCCAPPVDLAETAAAAVAVGAPDKSCPVPLVSSLSSSFGPSVAIPTGAREAWGAAPS
jgi:hypothetical protein